MRYVLVHPDSFGQIVPCALQSIADNLVALAAAGGKSFLVAGVGDIGKAPAIALLGSDAQDAASELSVIFNTELQGTLDAVQMQFPDIHIYRLDVFSLTDEVVANPHRFGLSDVKDPCLSFGVIVHAVCARPDKYLFWDGIHPTRAGHRIIARAAAHLLIEECAAFGRTEARFDRDVMRRQEAHKQTDHCPDFFVSFAFDHPSRKRE